MSRSMSQLNSENRNERTSGAGTVKHDESHGELELPLSAADDRAPEHTEDAVDDATEMAARGESGAALARLRGLLAKDPGDTRARSLLAALLERRGDPEGALAELGRALDTAPDDVQLLCARATLLASRGRFDDAEEALRHAARTEPQSADVQIQLGTLFSKRARWREAIEPLLAAVAAAPERADAPYYLREAYNHIDELPAALAALQRRAIRPAQPSTFRTPRSPPCRWQGRSIARARESPCTSPARCASRALPPTSTRISLR